MLKVNQTISIAAILIIGVLQLQSPTLAQAGCVRAVLGFFGFEKVQLAKPASVKPQPVLVEVRRGVPLSACCVQVDSVRGLVIPASFQKPETYPYFAGNGYHDSSNVPGFTLNKPKVLGTASADLIPNELAIPRVGIPMRLKRALPEEDSPVFNTSLAGRGGTSEVYFHHPLIPHTLMSNVRLSEAWGHDHAFEVIKVRLANPWDEGIEVAAKFLRRDLFMYGFVRDLASHARFRSEPFIEVARITSTVHEHARGIIRQEVVDGVPVDKLQSALSCVLSQVICSKEQMQGSHRLLRKAGASENPEGMQEKILALEQFYKETHVDAVNYLIRNGGDPLRNWVKAGWDHVNGPPHAEEVGIDFNHGQNVLWSPSRAKFVLIDW